MLLRAITTGLGVLLLTACSVQPTVDRRSAEGMADAVVIVIEDPRASLRRIGAGPGYGLPSAYADDPLLKRRSAAIARDYDLSIIDEWPLRNLGVHCFAIERPSAAVLAAIDRDERIKWLQPFNEFALQSNQSTTSATSENCALCQFKAQFDSPGRNITIAVIDTAVDTDHPDLRRSSLVTRNFAGPRGNPDEEDHGTAVVGLINAIPSTEHGVDGLAPAARVHLLRGCWQDNNAQGRCNTLTLALALDAAVDLAPDILNLSLTGRQDRLLDELLGKLLANGTLVFAAHDEQRKAEERFPARQLGVVYAYGVEETVAASAPSDPNVLYAPRHALSLATMGGYDLVSGHSIATPQLAAMAARLMEHDASRSRADTIQTLKDWLKDYYGALFAE